MKHALMTIGFPPEQGGLQQSTYAFAVNLPGNVTAFARSTPGFKEFDANSRVETIRYSTTPLKELIFKGLGRINPFAPFYTLYQKSVKNWIRANKPDVVHCMHINTSVIGHLAKQDFGIPYFLYCFGKEVTPPYLAQQSLLSKLAKPVFENADRIYCTSNYISSFVVPFVSRQDKVRIAPFLGVDTKIFKLVVTKHTKQKHVLSVGDISSENGIIESLYALAELVKLGVEVKWTFAGQGRFEKGASEFIKANQLENHIELVGHYTFESLKELYENCDVYVVNSKNCLAKSAACKEVSVEGAGTGAIIANACGKPVIASRSGALPEIITDGVNGMLIDPDNSSELSDKLYRLLSKESLAAELGRNGADIASRNFSVQKAVSDIAQEVQMLKR